MALTQTSLSGGRVTGGHSVQYTLVGTGAAQSDAPALGENITTYTGSAGQPATPSTTGMTTLLCSESSSVPHPQFKAKWAVRAVFEAIRTVTISGFTLPTGWYVTEISPRVLKDERRGTAKDLILDVPSTVTDKTVEQTYSGTYPGDSGLFAPYLQRFRLRSASRPGRNELVLHYLPPTWGEVVEDNPGRGVLYLDIAGTVVDRTTDKDGKRVVGEFDSPTTTERFRYIIVKGGSKEWVPRCGLILDVAVTQVQVQTLMALVGKVNNAGLVNFGNAAVGTLLFLGAKSQRVLVPNSLYRIQYAFSYNPEGWKDDIEVQKQVRQFREQEVLDEDGASKSPKEYQRVEEWVDVGDTETRNDFGEASFAVLEAMISW